MHNWHATGIQTHQIVDKKLLEVLVGGKRVCLLKIEDKIMAFTALCPHASAPLANGWVDALGRVVCPLHKYCFDPITGRNTTGEGYKLFRYATEMRDDEIFVGFL